MRTTCLSAALLLFCVLASAVEPKWFAAPVVDKAPALSLSDPAWDKALKIPFTKLEDGPGDTTRYPTESYWLRSGGSLFVAFKCVNPSSPKLWAIPKQLRDSNIYTKESVELFVGDSDGDLYYQLIFDAAGNIFDGQRFDPKWNGDWKRQVEIKDGYWTAAVELPEPIFSTIWRPGSFMTIDVTRHGFNADGSGGETMAISPPGVHSPEDRVFLGDMNPAALGAKLSQAVGGFKAQFAKTELSAPTAAKLATLLAFVADCAKAGDVDMARYREFHARYVEAGKELRRLEQEVVLDAIFGGR